MWVPVLFCLAANLCDGKGYVISDRSYENKENCQLVAGVALDLMGTPRKKTKLICVSKEFAEELKN